MRHVKIEKSRVAKGIKARATVIRKFENVPFSSVVLRGLRGRKWARLLKLAIPEVSNYNTAMVCTSGASSTTNRKGYV